MSTAYLFNFVPFLIGICYNRYMIKETGTVVETKSGEAVVLVCRSTACEGCAAKGACTTLGGGGKDAHVSVENKVGAHVGDEVQLGIEEGSLVLASFIVYILPIGALFLGAALGGLLADSIGIAKGGASAFMGLLALILGFVIIRLLDPYLKKKERLRPRIIKVIRKGKE
jgi:sigma-E factor negative regulatory protein RseC